MTLASGKAIDTFVVVKKIPVQLRKSELKEILGITGNHEKWLEIFTDDFLMELGFKDAYGKVNRQHFNNRRAFWPNETAIIFKRFHIGVEELDKD